MNNEETLRFKDDYQDPDTYWKTTDTKEAAALETAGCEIVDLVRLDDGEVCFVFDQSDGIDKKDQKFWAENLKVDAITLFNNYQNLMSRVRSMQR